MIRTSSSGMSIRCCTLTPDRWPDLEKLFGPHGAQGGCWCMWWRQTTREFAAGRGQPNREAFRAIVDSGEEPGILAYVDNRPVGWCAVAPRERYPRLERSRTLKPIDNQPVWSITCFFVDKGSRGRGITVRLLEEAVDFVRRRGGRIVEGYPIVPSEGRHPAAFAYTGIASAFAAVGFVEKARSSATRAIMRREVGASVPG